VTEEADRLAKEGAIELPPNQFAAIPFSIGENLIKKQLEESHPGKVDCLYWVSAIHSADELSPD
jgi:hypothetical protein